MILIEDLNPVELPDRSFLNRKQHFCWLIWCIVTTGLNPPGKPEQMRSMKVKLPVLFQALFGSAFATWLGMSAL
jgi:hypothetical protein